MSSLGDLLEPVVHSAAESFIGTAFERASARAMGITLVLFMLTTLILVCSVGRDSLLIVVLIGGLLSGSVAVLWAVKLWTREAEDGSPG